jgi:undecaprenyl-phosphate galactose phosphotransferase
MNSEVNTLATEQITTFYKIKRILYLTTKRIIDILFSLIGLILLIPIAIIIKISYVITGDFTSIFFVQDRIGKNGKHFKFFKFRSMVPNADEILFKTLEMDKILEEEYTMYKKLKKDPRITPIGKLIRKFSIDEMPQFINIFLGDMSLIGNRPYLPREKKDMGSYYDDIIKTKPGLTGYWQVSGRSDVTFQRRLELEQYYSEHCGLLMDIKIFFKTFKVVFFGKDAK